jgi:hypothetical protein
MAVVAMVRVTKAAEHWSQQGTKNDRDDASQGGRSPYFRYGRTVQMLLRRRLAILTNGLNSTHRPAEIILN